MATSMDHRVAPAIARDGVDTRPLDGEKDNSVMPAGGSGETTSMGAAHARGGQPAASVRVEDIYRRVYGEDYDEASETDHEAFEQTLEDLVDVGLLVTEYDRINERTTYRARAGLSWPGIVHLDCPKKKELLLTLIENPQTFFVLYNTQKGKMRIAAQEIRGWATAEGKKVVAFLVVDNDKTLADQSADGVKSEVSGVAKVFLLSSNSAETTLEGIQTYIDAYAGDIRTPRRYLMPVVVALNNATQIQKVLALMSQVKEDPRLRYGVVFDEADKVYPPIRGQFAPLLVDDNTSLHRLGFVTATDGDLMESEYEECANAHMYTAPTGDANYRAIHTAGAAVREVPHLLKDSNDVYAEKILANHREHFKQTVTLNNATQGFRKTIVNGGGTTASMTKFARNRVADGDYAITVNMLGVRVYRPGHEEVRYSTKGKRFGQLLFSVYTELGLHDRPLFIIGRRKVDRGLGFHWAPRDGSAGLVWTDMILGRVDDKDTAVQKAGRLAGVVAQCPQCPVTLTWWTDEKTASTISRHNSLVDDANSRRGCSVLQAMTRAEATVPRAPRTGPNDVLVSEQIFETVEAAKAWGVANLDQKPANMGMCDENGANGGQTHFRYRGEPRLIVSEQELRASGDIGGSQATINSKGERSKTGSPRVMPVLVDGGIWFVVVYKRFNLRA